jgi:hypothetical protein
MAASLTLVAASHYALKYEWVHDGVASGSAQRTQAEMLADFAGVTRGPSPLKAFLAGIVTDLAWDGLEKSSQVSLYATISNLPAGTSVDAEFEVVVGPTRVLQVTGVGANPGRAIVEVRFNHTYDR